MNRLIAFLLLLCLGAAPAAATERPAPDAFPVCYDFGCKTRQIVTLSPEEWREVAGWFVPAPADAAAEREQIRRAIGWIEVLIGRHTPTHLDKGRNDLIPTQAPGQLDCIDESTNATTYLRLLEHQGLLHFHRVLDRAYRRALLDQHWAGQIEELKTGERFVVDSWFADNGSLPYIQSLDKWLDIPFFGTSFDATF